MNIKVILLLLVLIVTGVYFAGKNQTNKPQTPSPLVAGEYFEVKELGIRFKITSDIKDLYYSIEYLKGGKPAAYFSTTSLANEGGQYCVPRYVALGVYSKVYKSELSQDPNSGNRYEPYLKAATKDRESSGGVIPSSAKEFSEFYVVFNSPQSPCSEKASIVNKQTEQFRSLSKTVKTVELLK